MPNPNAPAPGVPYYTPAQNPPAGTALDPQPDEKLIPKLFQALQIRGVQFQNRIFVSPMCQYSAKDGFPTPWHQAHLGGIFTRGPGLTMVEATAITREGRITPEDLGIWSDDHIQPLAQIVQFAHSQNQKIGIQLNHAGRKASTVAPWLGGFPLKDDDGWPDNVWGPSAVPHYPSSPIPKVLTKEGINAVVIAFAEGAKRAVKAGFDVIEIHNAHGYLLMSFLSPNSNRRTDEYGGSFENRIRFTLEVVDAIRAVIPKDMPLFLRVSGTEWLEEVIPNEPSWRAEDTARIAPILAAHGVDLLDVSGGGCDARQKIRIGPGYQVPFAEAAKRAVGSSLYIGSVGGLHDAHLAESVLRKGQADVINIGRQFQKNPGQIWAMAEELNVNLTYAHQISWGFAPLGRGELGSGGKDKNKL